MLRSSDYAIGKWQRLRVEVEGHVRNFDTFKKDAESTLVRSESNVLRESVRRGDQIDHYTNPDRATLFGYSKVFESEGRVRDWIRDTNGKDIPLPEQPAGRFSETGEAPRSARTQTEIESSSNDPGAAFDIGKLTKGFDVIWPAEPTSWSAEETSTPATDYVPQTTYHHDPATDYVPQTTYHHDPATDYVPQATYHHDPATDYVPQTTYHHDPATDYVPQTTYHPHD